MQVRKKFLKRTIIIVTGGALVVSLLNIPSIKVSQKDRTAFAFSQVAYATTHLASNVTGGAPATLVAPKEIVKPIHIAPKRIIVHKKKVTPKKVIVKKKIVKKKIIKKKKVIRKKISAKKPKATSISYLAKKTRYSPNDVRLVVAAAAKYYKLSAADTAWLKSAVIDIVFPLPGKPANESGGNTHCRTGQYGGLVQFSRSWGADAYGENFIKKYEPQHKGDWRMSGVASIFRLVKTFKIQGKTGIRRHWEPTLGK